MNCPLQISYEIKTQRILICGLAEMLTICTFGYNLAISAEGDKFEWLCIGLNLTEILHSP